MELFPTLVELENEIGIYDYAGDEIVSFLATVIFKSYCINDTLEPRWLGGGGGMTIRD